MIGWPEVFCILVWRLAPGGVIFTRRDLGRLPMDRVLLEDRRETEIRFTWITLEDAQERAKPVNALQEKAGVSEMQGRWQKLGCVLLWKLAKSGCTITHMDRNAVPADRQLLLHAHADDLEYRFVPHAEAKRIADWERFNEGRSIVERAAV
jgi:hypothetical protein